MSAEARILFLRGVNVGAHRKLPMADLRALLSGLGLNDVATHIQSGNAVFTDPQGRGDIGPLIAGAIGKAFPFTPEAMVLDRAALDRVLALNPFAEAGAEDGAKVQIGFLSRPSTAPLGPLEALLDNGERLHRTDDAVYLHAPAGIGRSKLAAHVERLLKVPLTMRNQRVAEAVAALARGL